MSGERTNLPARRTSIIGRDHDLAAVSELILHAEGRLLTLTGAGGCGKTRLALEVGRSLLPGQPDGVWLVDLAILSDPALVPRAVASTFGLREGTERSLPEALVTYLKTRQLLLVLDNCEHLIDACAALTERLLATCPQLLVLATSREPLRIDGEVLWRIPSLAYPDPRHLPTLEDFAASPAVRLFVERARAAESSFSISAHTAPAVAQICARLDGMPLALELAAARVRTLPLEQIVVRLGDSFRLLIGGSRTVPSRQQTLKATLDWSYALLTGPEQVLLRRLAVCVGGFEVETAEQVCSGDGVERADVLDVLTRLVDKSLVLLGDRDEEARYRLLEPVHQYATQLLMASGEAETVRNGHAAHFLALAERVDSEMGWRERVYAPFGNVHQLACIARLERDHPNLRAALRSLQARGEAEGLLRFGVALWRFWFFYGHSAEGLRWMESALAQRAGLPAAPVALALSRASLLAKEQGDYPYAVRLVEESIARFEALGDTWNLAMALNLLGTYEGFQGDFAAGRRYLERSNALYRALGDRFGLGNALFNLGKVVRQQGTFDEARALIEEGLLLLREAGDLGQVVEVLTDLAGLAQERGDVHQVEALAREALELLHQMNATYYLPDCLELLAGVERVRGEPARAALLLGAAAGIREVTGATLEPSHKSAYQHQLVAVRAALPTDRLDAAWTAGRALSPMGAIEAALAASEQPPPPRPEGPAGGLALLTARERDVAVLIARGLTNRQIAETLVIAEGTVAIHVNHILGKLACSSRVQVAALVGAQGAVPEQTR